jgi:hypothetical protein
MEGVSGAMPYPYSTDLRVTERHYWSRADRVERSYSTSGCAVVVAAFAKE